MRMATDEDALASEREGERETAVYDGRRKSTKRKVHKSRVGVILSSKRTESRVTSHSVLLILFFYSSLPPEDEEDWYYSPLILEDPPAYDSRGVFEYF